MHIPGCKKNGAFHIGIQKNRVIHILFVEKRGPIIYLAALKKGPFGTHIRTMPYIGSYPRPLHPLYPPPFPRDDRIACCLLVLLSYKYDAAWCSGECGTGVQWFVERCGAVEGGALWCSGKASDSRSRVSGFDPCEKTPCENQVLTFCPHC